MASAILSKAMASNNATDNDVSSSNAAGSFVVDTLIQNPSVAALSAVVLGSIFILLSQSGALEWNRAKSLAPRLPGIAYYNAYKFFIRRYDFARDGFKRMSGSKNFSFNVVQHKVIEMSGASSRHFFFNDSKLNFTEGYRILMGGSPTQENIDPNEGNTAFFSKRIVMLLRRDRLIDFIPQLMSDIDDAIKPLGSSGQFDPFKEIYDVVFRMTVRMASCTELANNEKDIARMQDLYFTIEKAATPLRLMFPSLPWPAKKRGTNAAADLYNLLKGYIDMRKEDGAGRTDAFDTLIGLDDSDEEIVNFVMGTIFAGVINTGMNSSWTLLYLSLYPEWCQKAADEINGLLDTHSTLPKTEPLSKRLASVPISAYEDDMPLMDNIIREDLRLIVASNTLLRRNAAPHDIVVPGRDGEADFTIDRGAFMAYNVADIHFDPLIYPSPHTFDPARYNPGREEDKKTENAFLGWGVGRHPCLGMKVAKLEMKMILAYMLTAYDLTLVDKNGKPTTELATPDRNDIQMARPTKPTWLKYSKKEGVVL